LIAYNGPAQIGDVSYLAQYLTLQTETMTLEKSPLVLSLMVAALSQPI
jgi:hypothetical protein